jgi:hypothetical protein
MVLFGGCLRDTAFTSVALTPTMQLQSGTGASSFLPRCLICYDTLDLGGDSVVVETERIPTPAGRLYMTGDLRALTGLPRTHMDFYLREGIIQPTLRTGSGYLLFDDAELETLRAVLRWRAEGIGIREIRDRLGRPATN